MTEELTPKAGKGAPKATPAPAPETPQGTVAPAPQPPQDVEALVNAAIVRVRAEYEGADGHISRLKSAKDKEIARLKRQLATQQGETFQKAQQLMQAGDYETAAQALAGQVAALQQYQAQEDQTAEMVEWSERVMADLGFTAEDEEARAKQSAWLEKIQTNPDEAWNFVMDAAQTRVKAVEDEAAKSARELQALKESVPDLVKSEVARLLASAGLTPAVTGEGGTPPPRDDDWRKLPTGQLIKRGLKERGNAPLQRIQED